jgi:hypothetical protein
MAKTRPMERLYGALGDRLAAQATAGDTRVVLPFTTIEGILARPLPATARHRRGHRQWWRGLGVDYPHAWYGWKRVGWMVEAVDLATETVTFTRVSVLGQGLGNEHSPVA